METKDKKILDPTNNTLQISTRKDVKFFMFLSKIFLNKFETIELHALGEAISIAVRVSENLNRFGYANVGKIETFSFVPENESRENKKKIKMVVKLQRSPDFLQKVGNLQK